MHERLGRAGVKSFNMVRILKDFQRRPGKLLFTFISHVLIWYKLYGRKREKKGRPAETVREMKGKISTYGLVFVDIVKA